MWQVEWDEGEPPRNEYGDLEVDAIQYTTRRFPTKALAEQFATAKASGSVFGVATLVEVQRVTLAQIRADEECEIQWWQEGGEFWAEKGEREEVLA